MESRGLSCTAEEGLCFVYYGHLPSANLDLSQTATAAIANEIFISLIPENHLADSSRMAKLLPPLPFALTPEGSCCILPLASHQHSADKRKPQVCFKPFLPHARFPSTSCRGVHSPGPRGLGQEKCPYFNEV